METGTDIKRPPTSAETTKQSLIEAGLRLFGERGYDSVSTREIADQAAANIGSIAYHFGGKPGLRLACGHFVIEKLSELIAPVLSQPMTAMGPEQATRLMELGLENLARFLAASPRASLYANFILREVMEESVVVDHMYELTAGPAHQKFCTLFGAATGMDPESEEVRLIAFSMIGQVLYFRIGRPFVLRRMGWREYGQRETELLVSTIKSNLVALIAANRKG